MTTDARKALEAAEQCITDLLEVYTRGCSMQTLDLAVGELKRDALPLIRAALRDLDPVRVDAAGKWAAETAQRINPNIGF